MEPKPLTATRILKDFNVAYEAKSDWLTAAKEDIEFTYGDQWSEQDVTALTARGVKPLSINKIRPKIQLVTGIESQNRSDISCYPEGGEDKLKSEVATALVKHAMKQANGDYKISEQFELSLNVGEGFIEPYLDYTYDLLNGTLKFRVREYDSVFYDPDAREYDLSDAKYMCVLTPKLTKDELADLFPDTDIENKGGRIDLTAIGEHHDDGVSYNSKTATTDSDLPDEPAYDLLEYYYKKNVTKLYVADRTLGKLTEAENEEMALRYEEAGNLETPGSVKLIRRSVPEIWKASVSGSDKLEDKRVWSFPAWKGYTLIPFFCYRAPGKLSKMKFAVQGMPRALRDLNIELNKRRTQELHILNTSANSGWQYEQGTLTPQQEKAYQQFGAAPGALLVHQAGKQPPAKILPTPLSQGHAQLAAENANDIKETSGINDDMLAMNESQASGRAIMLRQKQGMVMLQKVFDNLSQTKRIIGRFILSQLGKIFDVETAMKVMGEEFCQANFKAPVMQQMVDPMTGQVIQQPSVDPMTGQPAMQYDENICKQFINELLNNAELGKYDVSIGESASSETIKFSNFMSIKELAQAGIPIPPDVIVAESSLSEASKQKIKESMASAQQQQAQAAMMKPAKPPKQ